MTSAHNQQMVNCSHQMGTLLEQQGLCAAARMAEMTGVPASTW